MLDFGDAFKYPFNRAKGMFNVFWILLPIFGWLALGGYGVRIVREFCEGKFEKLPVMKFSSDMKLGFFMFLKSIPFMVVYVLVINFLDFIGPLGGFAIFLIELFVVPILGINFMKKQTVESFFEFNIINVVFANLGDYLLALVKSIGLAIVFVLMMIVLVGFPALVFTQNIFLADFYRRRVK